MEKFHDILVLLVAVLGVMAVVMPFVIEFIKTMIGEKKVIEVFGVQERFCALVSALAGVIVYVSMNILIPDAFKTATIPQIIVIGVFFAGACSLASQIGYDKLIKWIINRK